MRIYCDFDGTITQTDTTDQVLEQFAHKDWLKLEAEWVAGRITAADCMRSQIALVQAPEASLNALLDTLQLRDGFIEFAAWCRANHLPLTVVSDGVDHFIRRILNRHGLGYLPVFSNRLVMTNEALNLDQPFRRAGCAAGSGVCKCDIVSASGADTLVFIGDGRSDFCVSGRANILFARASLATYAAQRNQPYLAFESFFDVQKALESRPATRVADSAPS